MRTVATKRMLVAVDAGHGLPDPGAVGVGGRQECDVTLFAAHCLRDQLRPLYHQTLLTRYGQRASSPDGGSDLGRRCHAANDAKVDAFVSIHCNAVADPNAHGFEIYHAPGSARGKALADSILRAITPEIVVPHGAECGARQVEARNPTVKEERYKVLVDTQAPAVLLELAFITNPREALLLTDPDWILAFMHGVAAGVDEWGKKEGAK